MRRWRVGLVALCVWLTGCGPAVRFTDDSALTLNPRLAGRWLAQSEKERAELQIAAGRACGLVQMMGEEESFRLCSIAAAGDYMVLAAHELGAAPGSPRRYLLWLLRWHTEERISVVALDIPAAPEALDWSGRPVMTAECAAKPAPEQRGCADLEVDPTQLPAADAERLAALFRAHSEKTDDETVFDRIDPSEEQR